MSVPLPDHYHSLDLLKNKHPLDEDQGRILEERLGNTEKGAQRRI